MLLQIEQLIRAKGPLTTTNIARKLDIAPEALVPMLSLLMKKGRIRAQFVSKLGQPEQRDLASAHWVWLGESHIAVKVSD